MTVEPQGTPEKKQSLPLVLYGVISVIILGLFAAGMVFLVGGMDSNDQSSTNETVGEENTPFDSGTAIDPPLPLEDFTLTANNGEPLSLSDLHGKYVLLYFGYTHCPDACPMTLLDYRQIKRDLGEDAENVAFVMVSVDPERDTPDLLNRYLERYDPSFIGLSGDEAVLQNISDDFGLYYARRENTNPDAGYMMDHTSSKFLLNPEGQLIHIYSLTTDYQIIVDDLEKRM